jgi:FkbM family methyltransferase
VVIRRALEKIVSNPRIASTISSFLISAGIYQQGYRVAGLGNSLPEVLVFRLPPSRFAMTKLSMRSVGGKDQVARRAAKRGWTAFEHPFPEVFSAFVEQHTVVLDVGANTGFYSLLAAAVDGTVKVHAFEPLPTVLKILRENIRLNGIDEKRITVVDKAVGAAGGQGELYVPEDNHGLVEASASLNRGFRDQHSAILKVALVTLDDYVSENGLERVDLVKIDVESMEHIVLQGANKLMTENRPVIFLEILETAACDKLTGIIRQSNYVSVLFGDGRFEVKDSIAVDPGNTNQMLCPAEGQEKLSRAARALGYQVAG